MVSILIFLLGCSFVLLAYNKLWILSILVALFGLVLIIGVERLLMTRMDKEMVIRKLCYIYVIVDFAFGANQYSNKTALKVIKRTLRELAIDTCGPGRYNTWMKWEAYFRQKFENIKEEE